MPTDRKTTRSEWSDAGARAFGPRAAWANRIGGTISWNITRICHVFGRQPARTRGLTPRGASGGSAAMLIVAA